MYTFLSTTLKRQVSVRPVAVLANFFHHLPQATPVMLLVSLLMAGCATDRYSSKGSDGFYTHYVVTCNADNGWGMCGTLSGKACPAGGLVDSVITQGKINEMRISCADSAHSSSVTSYNAFSTLMGYNIYPLFEISYLLSGFGQLR